MTSSSADFHPKGFVSLEFRCFCFPQNSTAICKQKYDQTYHVTKLISRGRTCPESTAVTLRLTHSTIKTNSACPMPTTVAMPLAHSTMRISRGCRPSSSLHSRLGWSYWPAGTTSPTAPSGTLWVAAAPSRGWWWRVAGRPRPQSAPLGRLSTPLRSPPWTTTWLLCSPAGTGSGWSTTKEFWVKRIKTMGGKKATKKAMQLQGFQHLCPWTLEYLPSDMERIWMLP